MFVLRHNDEEIFCTTLPASCLGNEQKATQLHQQADEQQPVRSCKHAGQAYHVQGRAPKYYNVEPLKLEVWDNENKQQVRGRVAQYSVVQVIRLLLETLEIMKNPKFGVELSGTHIHVNYWDKQYWTTLPRTCVFFLPKQN